jgi:hypothetical protein
MDRNARPLNEVAVNLLPTPTVADSRGTRNATAGRQTDNPNVNLCWTLTDVAYSGQLLPTPTRADGERTSTTFGRGNPTLLGAVSPPLSPAGQPSPDDPPPGQLMIAID